jgi:fatty-acyl-CoA synthase
MEPAVIRRVYDDLSGLTVWEALERTATRLPDKVAVIDGDRRLTYTDLLEGARRYAAGLAALGLQKGDMAAVYLPNCAEMYWLFYALQGLGVTVAWINPSYRQTESKFILENSGAKAIFLRDEWQGYDYLSSIVGLGELPDLQHIVVARDGEVASADSRVRSLRELGGDAPAVPLPAEGLGPDDLSMLIYTSGTTGRSKGASISQSQVLRAGFSYSLGTDAGEDDVFIAFLPMSHSYGCGTLLVQPIVLGATVAMLDVFSPEKAFQLIEKERVTLHYAAPAHYAMELKSPVRKNYDISSLRAGMTAGALAPAGMITRVQDEMGFYISSFLGSSEVGPGLSLILPLDTDLETRERCVGYPLEYTEAKVVDPDTGVEKAVDEAGELVLKGWHVTRGYWKNPKETALQIRDGWLHTGDLVARDERGCFRIMGRLKEWINRGGFKIVPSEIESLLAQHPAVVEVCVVGTPNPVLGESICTCLLLDEGAEPVSLDDIRGYLNGKVADYKLPDELLVVRELPRLAGGVKVNKFGPGGVVEIACTSSDKQTRSR